MNGYNSDTKEYYAIEDDAHQKYGIITESESTLISSVQSNYYRNDDWRDYLQYTLPES